MPPVDNIQSLLENSTNLTSGNFSTRHSHQEAFSVPEQVACLAVGAVGTVLCAGLLAVFAATPEIRQGQKLIFSLALADFINCLSVTLTAARLLGVLVLENEGNAEITTQTSWTCELQPSVPLRLAGDISPDMLQVLVSMEHLAFVLLAACRCKRLLPSASWTISFSLAAVLALVAGGFVLAHSRRDVQVSEACYPEEVFGDGYADALIAMNIGFCAAAAALNSAAAIGARFWLASEQRSRQRFHRLAGHLVISVMSVLLDGVPDALFLATNHGTMLHQVIGSALPLASALDSASSLFIYLALQPDQRRQIGANLEKAFGPLRGCWRRAKRSMTSSSSSTMTSSSSPPGPPPLTALSLLTPPARLDAAPRPGNIFTF